MAASDTVYLNGQYLPRQEARVPVDDRGFLFADGVYEVTPAYRGRFFRLDRHVARMRRGLDALEIEYGLEDLEEVHSELLQRNGLQDEEVSVVYYQVTRGAAPRTHHFPRPAAKPTVYAYAGAYRRPPREEWQEGFSAITVPDQRWGRADLKTTQLLPNTLAQERAKRAGVADAIFVRDGMAMEGAHNNLFAVVDGTVVTHPASNQILHGIIREFVLELAREEGFAVEERPIPVDELHGADELFFTGTTTEIRPTVQVDGRPVGDGRVGPVARRLFDAFLQGVARECGLPEPESAPAGSAGV